MAKGAKKINQPEQKELSPEQKESLVEYLWKWFSRFLGLVVLIVGLVAGLSIYAARTTLENTAKRFEESGAERVAEALSRRANFAGRVAAQARAFPVGTILIWWGDKKDIPAGWALCDGTCPEPNYTTPTPNLSGRVIVGAGSNGRCVANALPIRIPEPARELQPGGGAPPNQGLGDGGRNVQFHAMPEQAPFLDRPRTTIPAGNDFLVELTTANLPRAEVQFIIRYKEA